MGNAMKISVCFFIYLCVCIPHINGQNDLMENMNDMTVNSVERTLLECAFDLMTGDHICDCDNRNAVMLKTTIFSKLSISFHLSDIK